MIVLSNSTEQTLAPGQAMIFDKIVMYRGKGECYRPNTGTVGLRANGGIYGCACKVNIGGETAATPVSMAVAINGAAIPETSMVSTPAAVGDVNTVSCDTSISTCCGSGGGGYVTVINNGTTNVVVAPNCCLKIGRTA